MIGLKSVGIYQKTDIKFYDFVDQIGGIIQHQEIKVYSRKLGSADVIKVFPLLHEFSEYDDKLQQVKNKSAAKYLFRYIIVKMNKGLIQKVFLLPDDLMNKNLIVIRLKHPRTNSDTLCALDPSNQLYEILHYGEEISSWFIDESVSDDGSLYMLTILDPLFFILSYANQQAGKFCPIEDLLMDENFPDTHYLSKCCSEEELRNIFDSKESAGYKVFSYNKKKTLHWLQQKTKLLAKHLESNNVDISDGSKAAALRSDDLKSEEQCLLYSCHLLSEYLSDELNEELFSSLGLEKTTAKEKIDTSKEKSKKQNISVKPEDDYSKQFPLNALQDKQKKKLTAAQKQLMKVDKSGMKSISSFFQKK